MHSTHCNSSFIRTTMSFSSQVQAIVIVASILAGLLVIVISTYLGQRKWIQAKQRDARNNGSYGRHTLFGFSIGLLFGVASSLLIYFATFPDDFTCAAAIVCIVLFPLLVCHTTTCMWTAMMCKDGAFEKGGFGLFCAFVCISGLISTAVIGATLGGVLGSQFC